MLDVYNIVMKLESLGFVRTHKRIGNYLQVYCPFHKDGQEQKPSCGVLLVDEMRNGRLYPAGFWHCFSCGFAKPMTEAITILLQQRNISKSGLDWLKENIPGFSGEDVEYELLIPEELSESITAKYAIQNVRSLAQPKTQQYVSEEELASYRFTVPYMYERKLTDEIIDKFDIGYDANWIPPGKKKVTPCITFPVRDAIGRTLFFCRRSIVGKMYNLPEGVTKPVYGLDMIPKNCTQLIICESIINALTCWTWGYPAVALMGTGNTYQIEQLKRLGIREFIICLDGDEAGRKGSTKLYKVLKRCSVVWVINMTEGKDVNDLSKDEFLKLYEERE